MMSSMSVSEGQLFLERGRFHIIGRRSQNLGTISATEMLLCHNVHTILCATGNDALKCGLVVVYLDSLNAILLCSCGHTIS